MFLSPILITQLAIATVVFEYLHSQTFLTPIDANLQYLWLIPYFFTISYFVLDDLTKFITHALMHKIPILWEIHKTHHSARTLTPITIFRTHPLEGVIFVIRSALTQGVVIALFFYIYGNKGNKKIEFHEQILLIFVSYFILSLLISIPYYFSNYQISFINYLCFAIYNSSSGSTTEARLVLCNI